MSIGVTPEQHEKLHRLADLKEASLAEMVRRGVELLLEENASLLVQKDGTDG